MRSPLPEIVKQSGPREKEASREPGGFIFLLLVAGEKRDVPQAVEAGEAVPEDDVGHFVSDVAVLPGFGHQRVEDDGVATVGVIASIAATEVMVLLIGIRAPIQHQEWQGRQGALRGVSDCEEGCYYCGMRPRQVARRTT